MTPFLPGRLPRRPRVTGLIALVALLIGLLGGTVLAASPRLSGAISDETGLLSGGTAQIDAAQRQLFDETGVQLYVLFVTSTGGEDIGQYALDVGTANGLTGTDALLVVATDDRTDWLQTGPALRQNLSQNEIDAVLRTLEGRLKAGDFVGGVVVVANGLLAALPQTGATSPPTLPLISPAPTAAGPRPTTPPSPRRSPAAAAAQAAQAARQAAVHRRSG